MTATRQNKKSGGSLLTLRLTGIGRDEATRTPDPYVPNVVRYQLRYIPNADAKVNEKTDNRAKTMKKLPVPLKMSTFVNQYKGIAINNLNNRQ